MQAEQLKFEEEDARRLPCSADRYVLMTAAYNEGAHIERTIQSVLAQTVLPIRWVIVSDGSTDETDAIIERYSKSCDFIRFLRKMRPPGHSFRSKIVALQAGYQFLDGLSFAFIGNLDADTTIGPSYFEDLLNRFQQDPKLGLAGGFVCEEEDGRFQARGTNRTHSVAHAAQLVREECYRAIGGYQVLEYGGEDWHAQVSAKMKGWDAEAFPDLPIYHHRRTGTGNHLLRASFRLGQLDYSFGSDPVFELIKCLGRFRSHPFILGSGLRISGFVWSWICREKRPVTDEFISFLRAEQKGRVSRMVRSVFGRGSSDNADSTE